MLKRASTNEPPCSSTDTARSSDSAEKSKRDPRTSGMCFADVYYDVYSVKGFSLV